MKKLFSKTFLSIGIMLLISGLGNISYAQLVGGSIYPINGTENPPTTFASITSAVTYLSTNGVTGTGEVLLELSPGYAGEPGPVTIGPISGVSSTLGIKIAPLVGYDALTSIEGGATPNQHAINIAGASYITLDGSWSGIGPSQWTVRTTGTNGQMAVRLNNTSGSMSNIVVRNLIMEGEAANITGAIFQITGGSANTISDVVIENNIIRSNPLAATIRGYGITLASASNIGNTGIIIRNNVINQFYARGINLTGGFPGIEVYDNEIYHTADVTQPSTTEFSGIYFSTTSSPGTKIYNNYIYNIRLTNGTTAVNGLYIFNGNSSGEPCKYYNNRISIGADLSGTAAPLQVYGLRENAVSGSLIEIDYNSVFVGGAAPSGTNTSAAFRKQASNFVSLRNNIFYNARTNDGGTGTGTHWAIMSNNTTYAGISNNDYFVDGVGGVLGTTTGTTAGNQLTLVDWQTAVPSDAGSVSQNPNFIAGLKINEAIATQLESGGAPIPGITTDFEGDVRNATTPDIGADEFNGIPLDLTPPAISYTLIANQSNLSSITLTATITDFSGVATGTNLPRLYIKKSSDLNYVFNDNPTVVGDDYTFTIAYTAIGGVTIGDTIQYYVAAQDVPGNAGTNPGGGSGANPPGTTPPSVPSFYLIVDLPLTGTYTVGLNMFRQVTGKDIYFESRTRTVTRDINGVDAFNDINAGIYDKENPTELDLNPRYETVTETYVEIMEGGRPFDLSFFSSTESRGVYPTITAAVNDLKLRGASGAVTFLLVDISYPSETYPIDLTAFAGASATNTVTIKPAAGVQVVIPGDAAQTAATIRLNTSGQYYIIDGSNTVGGSTRDLTITALGTSPAVHFFSSGDNNVVKNCILESQNSSTGSGTLILAAGTGSSNNLIDNCLFRPIESATRYGIGVYLFSSFTGVNNTISNCEFVDFNSRAIAIQGALGVDNNDAIGNEIYQLNPSTLTTVYGISIGRALNCDIVGNNIYGLSSTGATPTIAGLYYSGVSGVDMTVSAVNNVITFGGLNTAGTIRGIDYFGWSANSFEMYYNTVLLLGDEITGTIATAAVAKRDAAVNFKMVNNTFDNARSNSTTGTGIHYAVQFSNATATLWELNYNNYFVDGTGGILGRFGTTDALTLAEWQTATTQEANSLNSNPNYVSATDLRLQFPTPLYGAGTPVAGITTDFLGDLRSASTPTIGAYENPVATIGWANLQWPPSATILAGATATVYAQIWIDGITNQPGQGAGIQAWIGVSDANTDPSTWTTWIPAVFNVDAGNNDEYMAMIGATLAPGTYYYASRFNVFNGDFVYGGYNAGGGGFWDGINNVSGVLTVDPLILNLWERSVAQANLPTWFGADTERGLAYGFTSDGTEASNHRVYVVSRNAGLNVRILNAENGTDV
ncbi:MAG: right-handed parallel beta-helix repeat-containing protein, partial [Ignavibacterium sp.]|nr:right-handed parallel beta-helix repeat-containing protein [Ignavibacterium sp.]